MNRKAAIILPVLIILVVISLSATAGLVYLYQKEHAQNIALQENIVDLNKRQALTEEKLAEAKKTASDLQLKLQETKTQVDSLTEELTQEKSKYNEISGQLDQIRVDLEKQKSLRQDLENKLIQGQAEGKKIKEELKLIQKQKADLEEKIKNLEGGAGGVELGRVVVSSESNAGAAAGAKVTGSDRKIMAAQSKRIEGKIMVINKEFNFAVINLGSKDNISLGDEFAVLSASGNPIGDLKVEKIHESMSAAGFSPDIKDLIKENDRIVKKVK